MKLKTFSIGVILLLSTLLALGETWNSKCSINKMYSQNKEFFLISSPFENVEEQVDGRTIVFTKDSVKLYEIPRYFDIKKRDKELFLSNDGKKIIYLLNNEYWHNNVKYKAVEIYENGVKSKEYALSDIIPCDKDIEDCNLFYDDVVDSMKWGEVIRYKNNATEFEKYVYFNPVYCSKDEIIVFCKKALVAKINLSSNAITTSKISDYSEKSLEGLDTLSVVKHYFNSPTVYWIPKLTNGQTIEQAFAEYMDMKVHPDVGENKYKRHSISISCYIDTIGRATLYAIDGSAGNFFKAKIEEFLATPKILFETKDIPKGLDRWLFGEVYIVLMNKDEKAAKKERKQELIEAKKEKARRLVADSIDGVYIPKNLEECFTQLDKMLPTKVKIKYKAGDTGFSHFGIGMWMRNNWGLWGGSRLQQYFEKRGEYHPDTMSYYIIRYYCEWLNGNNDEWQAFDKKSKSN